MPLYEYRCPECCAKFEKLRPMSDSEKPATCPVCGAQNAKRQLSTFAAQGACGPSGNGGGFT